MGEGQKDALRVQEIAENVGHNHAFLNGQLARLKVLLASLQRGVRAVEALPQRKLAAASSALGIAMSEVNAEGDSTSGGVAGVIVGCKKGASIHCRVMRRVKAAEPAHVIALDAQRTVFTVVVAGIREGQLLEGSNLVIREPELAMLEVADGGQKGRIRLVRVSSPDKLLVNGKVPSSTTSDALKVSASYSSS
jgi:hypothetical protein